MKFLKLKLSGILQYFAAEDFTTLRTTYMTSIVPTKRAIVGLISCAKGYARNSDDISKLSNSIIVKYKSNTIPILLEDFQTIKPLKCQKNYMNKFYKGNKFPTVSGNTRETQLIKNIQYLQNADFDVYIGAADELLEDIYNAIRNPVYALYLGKRSCIPNKPIVEEFILIEEEELSDVYYCA